MSSDHQLALIAFPSLSFPPNLSDRCTERSYDRPIKGFTFSGGYAGIKNDPHSLDFALAHCPSGATCAGVYTQNQVVAAPVTISRKHLSLSSKVYAVIVNSGNANACTGDEGYRHAEQITEAVSTALSTPTRLVSAQEVQLASTGVIGAPLPVEKLVHYLPSLINTCSPSHLKQFATAIMTTDNRAKVRSLELNLEGVSGAGDTTKIVISGCSKGAGMIHPNMATMLAYLFTDAPITDRDLQDTWSDICSKSFNAITIDGDTSTNDTALFLASGTAGTSSLKGQALSLFKEASQVLAASLAIDILRDGEGVEHIAHLNILGAKSQAEARQVAETIALSPLVKTAMNGCDPNWGRIIAAVGRSGVDINPQMIELSIGGTAIYSRGVWKGTKAETLAHQAMSKSEYSITLQLNLGEENFTLYTSDLSAEYVRINADYRS